MIRPLALLLVALPAVAVGQQVDSSAQMTVSSRSLGVADTTRLADTASATAGAVYGAADSVFLRAQRMVAEGQGDAGRALVQAQLDSVPIGSPLYVKALYWRAMVAATAAGAERDLRRIVIEYPLSPESADALLRLAQLEMARGDRQQALEHLDRLLLEHPNDPSRGRAGFWMGRLLFENDHVAAACARLDQAEIATPVEDVELRNQIAYYKQRCVGVDTSTASRADSAPVAPVAPAPVNVPAPVPASPPVQHVDSSTAPSRAPAARNSAPTASGSARATMPTTSRRAPLAHDTSPTFYTIQVAAFGTSAAAERLRAGLAERGYDVRVAAGGKYYRVQVGHYATRRMALKAAEHLKRQHIDGMVTEAGPR